jgi:hypothetical protein
LRLRLVDFDEGLAVPSETFLYLDERLIGVWFFDN